MYILKTLLSNHNWPCCGDAGGLSPTLTPPPGPAPPAMPTHWELVGPTYQIYILRWSLSNQSAPCLGEAGGWSPTVTAGGAGGGGVPPPPPPPTHPNPIAISPIGR